MRSFLILFLLAVAASVSAQKENIPTTEFFTIVGEVKESKTVSLNDLLAYRSYAIDSIVIINHLGERKSVLKKAKGVLLKDVLGKVEIEAENQKVLSEYYLVCTASDNYKVVFSWNEIFNSNATDSVYILTEHDGKGASLLEDRIAIISPGDIATGRRYVKGLRRIVIERVK
jgi:hypothetical protein